MNGKICDLFFMGFRIEKRYAMYDSFDYEVFKMQYLDIEDDELANYIEQNPFPGSDYELECFRQDLNGDNVWGFSVDTKPDIIEWICTFVEFYR